VSLPPALLSAALAVALGAAALAGRPVLAVVAALVVLCLAAGWARLLRLPSPRGSTAVLAAVGLVAVGVGYASTEPPLLGPLAGVVALGVLGEFLHQMLRTDCRPRLVESTTGTVAGQAVALLAAAWVALPLAVDRGDDVTVVAAAAVLGSVVGLALPLPPRVQWLVALPAGASAAALAGVVLGPLPALQAAGLGLLVAVAASALHGLLDAQPPSRSWPATLAVAAGPVATAGLAAYAAARVLLT